MKRLAFTSTAVIVLLSGCGYETLKEDTESAAVQADNKISCTIDGLTWTEKGNLIGVGGAVSGDLLYVAIGAHTKKNGEAISVSTGVVNVPFQVGTYSLPEGTGYYTREVSREKPLKEYSQYDYGLFYATGEKDLNYHLEITLSKIDTLASDSPDYTRVKMAGTFKFNVAYAPRAANGDLSDTCTSESAQRLLKHRYTFPKYNARICNAEKAKISANFEVAVKFSNKDNRILVD